MIARPGSRSANTDIRQKFDPRTWRVAGAWPGEVDLLTGAEASETAFKRAAPGHRVIHLATHGFFIGGRCESALGAASVAGIHGLDAFAVGAFEGGVVTLEELTLLESRRTVATARGRAEPGGALEMVITGDGIPGPLLGGTPGTRFDARL